MAAVKRDNFGSRLTFIFAMAGSAIGLGNIWRFPFMVGEYGGAAFIIIYILCSAILALPVFFCESIIGRRTAKSSYFALESIAPDSKWKYLGLISVITCFIIDSYYSVVGGWSLDYLVRSCSVGLDAPSCEAASSVFGGMASSVWEPILFHTLFIGASALIVIGGVKKGIEKFSKVTMPILLVLIVTIAVYSISLPGAMAGVEYLVKPDWSKVNTETIAYALGQAFFSLSLGVGCVLVYSSFMKKDENILAAGGWTAVFDTMFAIIAGFAVMPAVFSAGLEPGAGPALVFETIPYIFSQIGLKAPVVSRIITILFFLAIFMAALTSAVSLFEVCVEHLVEHRKFSRKKAAAIFFSGCWTLGILCSLSFGVMSDVKLFGDTIFDFCDSLSSNYLMTLGALAYTVFVGWRMKKADVRDEFTNSGSLTANNKIFGVLYFAIKWLAPVFIVIIFLTNLFL